MCSGTHATITAILAKQDLAEKRLEIILAELPPEGVSIDQNRDVVPEYKRLVSTINDYNRAMWTSFSEFWLPLPLMGRPAIEESPGTNKPRPVPRAEIAIAQVVPASGAPAATASRDMLRADYKRLRQKDLDCITD